MPNVPSLINKSNIKKLRNNQHTEPHKCNCTDKTNCTLKGKIQFVCTVINKINNWDFHGYKNYSDPQQKCRSMYSSSLYVWISILENNYSCIRFTSWFFKIWLTEVFMVINIFFLKIKIILLSKLKKKKNK